MKANVGKAVTYVDSHGVPRAAIVTNVFNGMNGGADGVNVVVVNDDESQKDDYGRKIQRFTSVCHKSAQPAHGNYWHE
jgi:hypothetical protein